jgi:uncharacterized membrane protein
MKEFKKRLKNRAYLLALSGLIYLLLRHLGLNIEIGIFQTLFDVIAFPIIGYGIHSTFGVEQHANN